MEVSISYPGFAVMQIHLINVWMRKRKRCSTQLKMKSLLTLKDVTLPFVQMWLIKQAERKENVGIGSCSGKEAVKQTCSSRVLQDEDSAMLEHVPCRRHFLLAMLQCLDTSTVKKLSLIFLLNLVISILISYCNFFFFLINTCFLSCHICFNWYIQRLQGLLCFTCPD